MFMLIKGLYEGTGPPPHSIPSDRALSRWWQLRCRRRSRSGLAALRFHCALPPSPLLSSSRFPPSSNPPPPLPLVCLFRSLSRVVFCLWGLRGGKTSRRRGSFKSTKPPVRWLGGRGVWPLETWTGSVRGRQAEGLLRRGNRRGMPRPVSKTLRRGCWDLQNCWCG